MPHERTSADPPLELADCARLAKQWLFDEAAPLWAGSGRLPNGMFAEALAADGRPVRIPLRTRVQARQIFSYCELGRMGWSGDWHRYAESAIQILLDRGRRTDGLFIHTFSEAGSPLDIRADLYDHAFVLFCLAHAGDALKRPELFEVAGRTMDLIERHWRHPAGGFLEGEIDTGARRQNPHMHLLEAAQALWQFSGHSRWKHLIEEISALCASRFIDNKSGALTEFFSEDWRRVAGGEGEIVEPGHCFEWAWLLERLTRSNLGSWIHLSDRLIQFSRAHGIPDNRDAVVNEILLDGTVRDGGLRVWPQTECLKAAMARFERTKDAGEANQAVLAFGRLRRHLDTPVHGLWRERQSAEGTWLKQPSPASTFYHIVCALSELVRTSWPSSRQS